MHALIMTDQTLNFNFSLLVHHLQSWSLFVQMLAYIEGLSVWNERCCKLNDSINVIKEMVDVKDEFKECQGFSREEVEGFIEMLCIID